jgi:hypothetical protein
MYKEYKAQQMMDL